MGAAVGAERHPIRLLGLHQVVADHDIQSRAAMSVEYQREFSEAMLRGDVFPPVVIFWDGHVNWLADGFHRHAAMCLASRVDHTLTDIRAEVREGSRRDAMLFSAGSNIRFSIPRTRTDIRKAVLMLLDDPAAFLWSDMRVAAHAGTTHTHVKALRKEFCDGRGLLLPVALEGQDGRVRVAGRWNRDPDGLSARKHKGLTYYFANVRGRSRALCVVRKGREEALRRLATLLARPTIARVTRPAIDSMGPDELVAEARRLGAPDGQRWRRLLWRIADVLQSATGEVAGT